MTLTFERTIMNCNKMKINGNGEDKVLVKAEHLQISKHIFMTITITITITITRSNSVMIILILLLLLLLLLLLPPSHKAERS